MESNVTPNITRSSDSFSTVPPIINGGDRECIMSDLETILETVFYATLEKILLTQHECVIMGDFTLPHIDWSLQQPTAAPGRKLLNLLLTMAFHNMCRNQLGKTTYLT